MNHLNTIFALFLLQLSTINVFVDTISCISCASKELEINWSSTTLIYPSNTSNFFDSKCDSANSENKVLNCPSHCFSMLVNPNSQFYIVRGCMNDFFNNTVISYVEKKLDKNSEFCVANQDKVDPNNNFYLKYCGKIDCNNFVKLNDFNPNCDNEVPPNLNDCYYCNKLYGNGKCEPNSGSTCKGSYCVKVTGHYGEAKFEERRCSDINPYQVNTCVNTETEFPLSLASSITAKELIKSTVCYCEGNLCNSSSARYISIFTFLLTILFITNN